jgi:Response regulator of the LytR/AlgR family
MDAHYAEITTTTGVLATRMTLKELTMILPDHFLSCHRSYIINMFKVACIFNDRIAMSDGNEIPVSRSRSKEVREFFMCIQTR